MISKQTVGTLIVSPAAAQNHNKYILMLVLYVALIMETHICTSWTLFSLSLVLKSCIQFVEELDGGEGEIKVLFIKSLAQDCRNLLLLGVITQSNLITQIMIDILLDSV